MFNWFRRKPSGPAPVAPKPSADNPGKGTTMRAGFANGEKTWSDEVNVLECLVAVLRGKEIPTTSFSHWVEMENGIILQPQIVAMQPQEKDGVKTTTTIEASHPGIFPKGVFEFQHSIGNEMMDSVRKGFDSWVQLDWPVLTDAVTKGKASCMAMQMKREATQDQLAIARRFILGPTMHMVAKPQDAKTGEHDFCPCCLFTNSIDAFKPLFEGDAFYGIRLFAARDADGLIQADCRVNGRDYPAGQAALLEYVKKWPDRGFEFRKQYVAIKADRNDQQAKALPQ